MVVCRIHGEQDGSDEVCIPCYATQQERVERESLPLRLANTAEALRASVLAHHAASNGSH